MIFVKLRVSHQSWRIRRLYSTYILTAAFLAPLSPT